METLPPLRDDEDEENCADEAKMLLIGENGVDAKTSFPLCDGAPELQEYNIRSVESTVVIRQLTSQGLSFQLWPAASTFVTLLDNYRLDPTTSPLAGTLSSLKPSGFHYEHSRARIRNRRRRNRRGDHSLRRRHGQVRAAPLRWGEDDDVEALGKSVDLVVASDVVYHDHLYEPLLKTLRLMAEAKGLLEGKRLVFLMAHLRRWKKESAFFKKARKVFDVDVIHSDEPQQGARSGVMVYRFVAKQPNQNGRIVSC
ncbi:hypothetical protein HA466_0253660 [Hirschfeldia incana]|nr:hypothetical protein HA466_0253660 [Hirschfeldia incana]